MPMRLNSNVVIPKGLHSASLFYLSFPLYLSVSLMGCAPYNTTEQQTPPSITIPEKSPIPPQFHSYGQWQSVTSIPTDQTRWQSLPYPELIHLLNLVPEKNPNIQSLYASYRSALASLHQVEAGQRPSGTLTANRSTGTLSSATSLSSNTLPTGDIYSLGASVSWEVDLWGKLALQTAEQKALLANSSAEWQSAILSTQALVGQTYLQSQAITRQIQLMRKTEQEQTRFIHITEARYRAGVSTRLDVVQAKTQRHNTQKELLELEAQYEQCLNALATLTGQSRDTFFAKDIDSGSISIQPEATIPRLIPSQLISSRPDIQAKQEKVTAANARLGYTKTAFLPTLTLSASITSRHRDWESLTDVPSLLWSLGPGLALTLFDGGKRVALTEQAQAEYEKTIAEYRYAVLSAFEEVENNLTTALMVEQAIDIQAQTIESAQTALQIAHSQYRAGTTDALTVINAQTQYWQAEKEMINLWLRHWQAYFVLTKQVTMTSEQ